MGSPEFAVSVGHVSVEWNYRTRIQEVDARDKWGWRWNLLVGSNRSG